MPQAQEHGRAGLQRYILNDFTGGLHSTGVVSRIGISDTECACAQDVEFWPVGTVSKRTGRICKNTSTQLSGYISNIWKWYDSTLNNHIMAFTAASGTTCSAQIQKSSGEITVWTMVIKHGGGQRWNHQTGDTISCVAMVGSAFFCNGVANNELFVYDGSAACCAVTDAPSGCKYIGFFSGYGFVANVCESNGTRRGSRVYWSDPNDPHSWPASQWLDLDVNDGEEITGICVLGNELIVFKKSKIFAISYVGGSFQFLSELRVNGKGCSAGGSIFPRYEYICFYGSDGFYRFDGREARRYSDKIKDFIVNINHEAAARIMVTAVEKHSQLWHLVPLETNANNCILVYDYDRNNWTLHKAQGVSCMEGYIPLSYRTLGDVAIPYESEGATWGDLTETENLETAVLGSEDGWLYYTDFGTSDASGTDSSVAITGMWTSRWLDFDMPDINKRITRVTLLFDNECSAGGTAHFIHVNMYKNWDMSTAVATTNIPLSSSNADWDILLEKRIDTSFTCRTMAVEMYTDSIDEPWTLHEIIVEYLPKGRTLVL